VSLGAILAILAIVVFIFLRGPHLSGTYSGSDGLGSMEFRGNKVYITTVLGTTYVSTYEVDGDHIVIKGVGGAQVFTQAGATLDGGVGLRFVKRGPHAAATPSPE
jgi:hypothetical protein